MSDPVPLDNLITALRSATEGGKSGAFFITTENQHSAMITLRSGMITGLKFRSARGYDAASALAKVDSLKYQTAAEPTELPGESDINTRSPRGGSSGIMELKKEDDLLMGERDIVLGKNLSGYE